MPQFKKLSEACFGPAVDIITVVSADIIQRYEIN